MKLYRLREEDRQFLKSLLYATGLILFWRGIWEVSYQIPLLKNVYFCLFVGLLILTLTGYIYREFDVFGQGVRRMTKLLHDAIHQTKRGTAHTIHYYDDIGGHEHIIQPHKVRKIEGEHLIIEEKGHEVFIPLARVTKVKKGNETIWRR